MLGEGVGVGDEDEFGDQAHELVNADGALPGLPPLNNQRSDATRNLKGYHTMSSTLTPMFEKQRKAFSNWQQPSWMGARRGVNFCSMTMNDYAKPQCVTRLFPSPNPQPPSPNPHLLHVCGCCAASCVSACLLSAPTCCHCLPWLMRCKLRVCVSSRRTVVLSGDVELTIVTVCIALCLHVSISLCPLSLLRALSLPVRRCVCVLLSRDVELVGSACRSGYLPQ